MNHLLAQHTNRSRCWRRTALSNSGSVSSLSPIRRSWNTEDLALSSNSLSSVFSLCGEAMPNQAPNRATEALVSRSPAAAYLADGLRAGPRYALLLALALLAEHVELAARPDGLERVAPLLRRRRARLHGHLGGAVLALLLPFALLLLAPRRRRHGLRLRHGRERGTGGKGEWGRRPLGFMGVWGTKRLPLIPSPQGAAQ